MAEPAPRLSQVEDGVQQLLEVAERGNLETYPWSVIVFNHLNRRSIQWNRKRKRNCNSFSDDSGASKRTLNVSRQVPPIPVNVQRRINDWRGQIIKDVQYEPKYPTPNTKLSPVSKLSLCIFPSCQKTPFLEVLIFKTPQDYLNSSRKQLFADLLNWQKLAEMNGK